LSKADFRQSGKKGVYRAGLNGNFHKSETDEPGWNVRDLEKMGVIYQGDGKWTLPKGAKIHRMHEIETFYRVQDGKDWALRLADGSEWIVWSEDIAGIDGPPLVNE
jgi:nuclear transport factor 2 (NTF2) superfamily protein